jgi:hypothetical protein
MTRRFQAMATIVGAAFTLAACATAPSEKVVTKTVTVPVPVSCAPKLPDKTHYPDTPEGGGAQATNIAERTQRVLAGIAERDARIRDLEAALEGCR